MNHMTTYSTERFSPNEKVPVKKDVYRCPGCLEYFNGKYMIKQREAYYYNENTGYDIEDKLCEFCDKSK